MSKLTKMHKKILELVDKVEEETMKYQRPDYLSALADSAMKLAGAYQMLRETELHEQFHLSQPVEEDFPIPGEDPLKNGNN
jgi:hypothetical protein